jgi:hypothetical protein
MLDHLPERYRPGPPAGGCAPRGRSTTTSSRSSGCAAWPASSTAAIRAPPRRCARASTRQVTLVPRLAAPLATRGILPAPRRRSWPGGCDEFRELRARRRSSCAIRSSCLARRSSNAGSARPSAAAHATTTSRPWSSMASASARSTLPDSTAPRYVPQPTERLRNQRPLQVESLAGATVCRRHTATEGP